MEKAALLVICVYRFGNYIYYNVKFFPIRQILMLFYKILNFVFLKMLFNTEIPAKCIIGNKLNIHHPYNIIINENAILGRNVTLRHQVTIGNKGNKVQGSPRIGDNVNIGTGSVLIGPINVGDNVIIGANSVVTKSIGDNLIVAGVPVKIIRKK